MERRKLDGDVGLALAALAAELGSETTTVGADTVWLQPGRFDRGHAGGGRRFPSGRQRRRVSRFGARRGRHRRPAAQPPFLLAHHAAAAREPADPAGPGHARGRPRRPLRRAPGRDRQRAERGARVRRAPGVRDPRRLRGRARARAAAPDGPRRLAGHARGRLRERGDGAGGRPLAVAPRGHLPRHEDLAGRGGRDPVLHGRVLPRADAPGRGRRHEAALVVRLRAVAARGQRRGQPLDQGGDAARSPRRPDLPGDRASPTSISCRSCCCCR